MYGSKLVSNDIEINCVGDVILLVVGPDCFSDGGCMCAEMLICVITNMLKTFCWESFLLVVLFSKSYEIYYMYLMKGIG